MTEINRVRQAKRENGADTYRQTLPSQCCEMQRRGRQKRKRGWETSEQTYMQQIHRKQMKTDEGDVFVFSYTSLLFLTILSLYAL